MKKIVISILALVLFVGVLLFNYQNSSKDRVFNKKVTKDNILSMMVETSVGSGKYETATSDSWPGDNYIFNAKLSKCQNGSNLSWDDTSKQVLFDGDNKDLCYLYFDAYETPKIENVCKNGDNLADCIKSLHIKQGDNNIYLHDSTLENDAGDGSYRYSGSSETTNNFVCFGYDSTDGTCPTDNLYRIIGVFGENVKLIKYDYANSDLLGTDGDYSTSTTPNASYYRGTKTSVNLYYWNYKAGSAYSNTWSTSLLNKTNLNSNFITKLGTIWSNKIATTTWKVGGNTWANIGTQNAKTAYTNEIITPAANKTVSAKVGLMYVSDYMYAASPTYWILVGYSYNSDATKDYRAAVNDNWLFMGVYEWTIAPRTDYTNSVFYVSPDGHVNATYSYYALRPVLALESSITYAGGAGTAAEPILIK